MFIFNQNSFTKLPSVKDFEARIIPSWNTCVHHRAALLLLFENKHKSYWSVSPLSMYVFHLYVCHSSDCGLIHCGFHSIEIYFTYWISRNMPHIYKEAPTHFTWTYGPLGMSRFPTLDRHMRMRNILLPSLRKIAGQAHNRIKMATYPQCQVSMHHTETWQKAKANVSNEAADTLPLSYSS